MILVNTDITPLEQRSKAIRQAHAAKREFGRVVSEELRFALLAEASFRTERDPSQGIRAALRGGKGSIHEEQTSATGTTVGIGIRYDIVPWWRVQDRPETIIRARNVRNLTIPANDEASLELYRAGGARFIDGLEFKLLGGRPALVKSKDPEQPFIWLKPWVKVRGIGYVAKGVERFRRTAWRRLIDTIGPFLTQQQ